MFEKPNNEFERLMVEEYLTKNKDRIISIEEREREICEAIHKIANRVIEN